MHSQWLEVAERQAGVITTAQLTSAGVERSEMRRLVRCGGLRPVDRAVWIASVPDSPHELDLRLRSLWVALLCTGSRAFAWRRSAAALWALDGCPWPDHPDIAVALPDHGRRPGTPRLRSIGGDDRTFVDGIPVTGAARTLADLAALGDDSVTERALESLLRHSLMSAHELAKWAADRRSAGARRLASMLARRPDGTPPTESDAETLFAMVARSTGLPAPRRQFGVLLRGRRFRLDFAWPDVRLAVEVDGTVVHGPDALDADLRRQNAIVLDGWLVLRFTWWTVVNRPDQVRRDLRAAWSARSPLNVAR